MRYLRRRLFLFVVTLWAALTVNFVIPRVMPGNEAQAVLGTMRNVNPGALHALELEFGVKLNWLPLGSNYSVGATPSFSPSFIWDVLKHALLPAISLTVVTAGLWVYSMRNNMITTIEEDYVKMGRAKGLPSRRVMFDY